MRRLPRIARMMTTGNNHSTDLASLLTLIREGGALFLDCEYTNPNLGKPHLGRPNVDTDLCSIVQIGCTRWDPEEKKLCDHLVIWATPEEDMDEAGWAQFTEITKLTRSDIMDRDDSLDGMAAIQKLFDHLDQRKLPVVVMLGDHTVIRREAERLSGKDVSSVTKQWYRAKPMLREWYPGVFDKHTSGTLHTFLDRTPEQVLPPSTDGKQTTVHNALWDACSMGLFMAEYDFSKLA